MKRNQTVTLKEALALYIEGLKIKGKLDEVGLVSSWEKVVGKTVAKATRNIYIHDRKLFVFLNSSVVRNELSMIREPLIERLNEVAGQTIIDDIVLK
jgi:hypothetical protein